MFFLNKSDASFEYYPAEYDDFGMEDNPWQEIVDKIEKNPKEYIEIDPMSSEQSFEIMEGFAEFIATDILQKNYMML